MKVLPIQQKYKDPELEKTLRTMREYLKNSDQLFTALTEANKLNTVQREKHHLKQMLEAAEKLLSVEIVEGGASK